MSNNFGGKSLSKDVLKEIKECKRAYDCSNKMEATISNIYKMKNNFFKEEGKSIDIKTLPEERLIEESFKRGKVLFPNLAFKRENIQKFLQRLTKEIILLNNQFKESLEDWLETNNDYLSKKEEYIEIAEIKELLSDVGNNLDDEMTVNKKDFTAFAYTFTLASLQEFSFKGQLSKINTDFWVKGSCPVCGLMPHYGKLRESDGKRILECWVCSVRWEFPRLKCPYCDNEKQDELGFFIADESKLCRVHFCSKCNCYHKIFDLRKYARREANLTIHNLATLSYDLMATREGFVAGSSLQWVNEEELKV